MTTGPTSRVLRRTPLAWDVAPDEPGGADSIRIPDFLAFVALAFPVAAVPFVGLPLNEIASGALCLVALSRPPTLTQRAAWFVGLLALLLVLFAGTSYLHHLEPVRRLLHLGLYVVLATFLATGRIHLRSAIRGVGLGLVISIVGSLIGFAPTGYTGRLSGLIGDPNSGGYLVIVLGTLAIGMLDHRALRLALIAIVPVAVVLTYSRTTLLALGFTLLWLVIGRRANVLVGLGFSGLMIYVVGHIPDQLRLYGPFADRTGSDQLRERIIAQEHLDIAASPYLGSGAGTAHVNVDGNTFFYHSSYLAMQREGGLVAIAIFVLLVLLVLLAALRRPPEQRNLWLESSLVAVMICAVNLGEVLLELPAAVVLGVLMHHVLASRPRSRGAAQ